VCRVGGAKIDSFLLVCLSCAFHTKDGGLRNAIPLMACLWRAHGAEWEKDPDLPRIVDELFIEVHYGHPSMRTFGWTYKQSRDEADQVLLRLRKKSYYVHAWP